MSSAVGDGFRNDIRPYVSRFFVVVILICLVAGQACAAEMEDILDSQANALNLDDLQQAVDEYVPDIDWTDSPDLENGLKDIFELGRDSCFGLFKKALRSGVLLLGIVFISGVSENFTGVKDQGVSFVVPIVSALAITAVAAADANTLIGLGTDVIDKMEQFSKVLLPTVAAVTAASGSPGVAAARQMAAMLFSDVLITLINRLLLPLIYTYIAVCTASAAIGNEGLKRIGSTLKWIITTVLTTVMLAFVSYLSLSSVIAKTTDAVALKATKFTVSTVVPVVGGILSDAAETVLAGAGILKNTVGVFGMLAVLGICILPFLQLGIHYLVYKVTAALSATVSSSRCTGLIDGIGAAFGLVLGMTGACALLLMVSLISAVSMVSL